MCFNNKYNYRTVHGGCYQVITKNKTSRKRKTKIKQFFNFSYKNMHDKIILFNAVLLEKKKKHDAGGLR